MCVRVPEGDAGGAKGGSEREGVGSMQAWQERERESVCVYICAGVGAVVRTRERERVCVCVDVDAGACEIRQDDTGCGSA